MHYPDIAIPDERIPRAAAPALQHILDTYASETNKVAAVWRGFTDADLGFRPHPRSSIVADILKHQLLSRRRGSRDALVRDGDVGIVHGQPLGDGCRLSR